MKIKNNGFSLIEVMMAMGLMAASAIFFASYMDKQHQNQSVISTKNALNDIVLETSKVINTQDACDHNLTQAFRDLNWDQDKIILNQSSPIKPGQVDSYALFSKLHELYKWAGKDTNGNPVYLPYLSVGDLLENGKIEVSDINYLLRDFDPDGFANVDITVSFTRCSNGRSVAREATQGTKVELCQSGKLTTNKTFSQKVKLTPGTQGQSNPIKDVSCLGNTSNNSKEELCYAEARLMTRTGTPGETSCGWKVEITPKIYDYTTAGNYSLTLPSIEELVIVPGIKIEMIGGGGGGGGGSDYDGGGEGFAGEFKEILLENYFAGGNLNLTVGAGGAGGRIESNLFKHWSTSGQNGSPSTINAIGKLNISKKDVSVSGGDGGGNDRYEGDSGDVMAGGDGKPSKWHAGGKGGYKTMGYGGQYGSGGGGGSDKNIGGNGGPGRVLVTWKTFKVFDENDNPINVTRPDDQMTELPPTQTQGTNDDQNSEDCFIDGKPVSC